MNHLGRGIVTGRNAPSHMKYTNASKSNCAAQIYLRKLKKPDQLKDLCLHIADWTKRLKTDDLRVYVQQQLRSA